MKWRLLIVASICAIAAYREGRKHCGFDACGLTVQTSDWSHFDLKVYFPASQETYSPLQFVLHDHNTIEIPWGWNTPEVTNIFVPLGFVAFQFDRVDWFPQVDAQRKTIAAKHTSGT